MKTFTFSALIRTSVGAEGYLYGEGHYTSEGTLTVTVGGRDFMASSVEDIVSSISQTLQVDFLEYNVADCCIKDVKEVRKMPRRLHRVSKL